jgi:hypothetical protein
MDANSQQAVLALFDAGVTDLVRLDGKRPVDSGWTVLAASRDEVESWLRAGSNIGLRTRSRPAIDCDVEEQTYANDLRRLLPQWLGVPSPPIRTGRPPRFAIACQADSPFPKTSFHLSTLAGDPLGALEFLGDGQQYVIAGTHPGHGRPYQWSLGNRTGGVELLVEAVNGAAVPGLSPEIIQTRIRPGLEAWAGQNGLRVTTSGSSGAGADRKQVDQQSLRAPSIDALRQAVKLIPNDYPDRESWRDFGIAIRASAGENHDEGLRIFLDWSDKWNGGNDPQYTREQYESFRPPYGIGWGYIADRAKQFGFPAASYEFSAIGEAAAVSTEFANAVQPLETEPERLAAIIEDPRPVFFATHGRVGKGNALLEYFRQLQGAVAHGDPLAEVYESTVMPLARRLGRPAKDERYFCKALRAELPRGGGQAWAQLGKPDRALLLRAAYLQHADLEHLTDAAGDPGVPLLLQPQDPTDDMVRGWLPRTGVGGVVAPPGAGKTFILVELAGRIASPPALDEITGSIVAPARFAAREVKHGSVLYFAAEDAFGVAARLADWAQGHSADLSHVLVFSGAPPLADLGTSIEYVRNAMNHLPAGAPPLRLIVIDTFRAAFQGDENSSGDVASAVATLHALARMFETSVMLAHHSTKSDAGEPRGSSALEGSLDLMLTMERRTGATDAFTVVAKKVKHGPAGDRYRWSLVDGILRQEVSAASTESSNSDAHAHALWDALSSIAWTGNIVSSKELNDAAVSRHPDLFADQRNGGRVNANTARSRIARAKTRAVELGWIGEVCSKKGSSPRYQLGPNSPGQMAPITDLLAGRDSNP